METLAKEPTLSEKEIQLKEADMFISKRINEVSKEGMSSLVVMRQIYEEVKGYKYREEQITAKLLELLAAQNEVDMRTKEVNEISPNAITQINKLRSAAKDERYQVAA